MYVCMYVMYVCTMYVSIYVCTYVHIIYLSIYLSIWFINFRFKKSDERGPYITAMKDLLPLMYNRMIVVLPNQSEPSVCLQRWMLKIFYCSMHVRSLLLHCWDNLYGDSIYSDSFHRDSLYGDGNIFYIIMFSTQCNILYNNI